MLAVENLAAAYGSVPVLNGVCLQVGRGEVLTLKERYFRVPQRASHPNTPRERINLLEVA